MRRSRPYNIIFEGERTYSYQGDIAIDDIELKDCVLPVPQPRCPSDFRFTCGKTRACISHDYLCDYTDDCGDNTDEENCPYQYYPNR